MPFYLNTTQMYKIWISPNPAIFMNAENKLRFIRMRLANPEATLSLVYSSACLTQTAIDDLKRFCQRLDIKPVDFDVDMPNLLKTAHDQRLYQLAKLEMQHTQNGTGGNLGGAKDCIAALTPAAELGIYTDFDVELNFSGMKTIEVKAPIISSIGFTEASDEQGTFQLPLCNPDFFALTYSSQECTKLSDHALADLSKIQHTIIANYATLSLYNFVSVPGGFFDTSPSGMLELSFFQNYLQKKPQSSIFECRKYLQDRIKKATAEHDETSLILAQNLINKVVASTSGPKAYFGIWRSHFDDQHIFKAQNTEPFLSTSPSWKRMIEEIRSYGVKDNHLTQYVTGDQNSDERLRRRANRSLRHNVGELCDLSWTPIGAQAQLVRSMKINFNANLIQHAFRRHLAKKSATTTQAELSAAMKTKKAPSVK